MSKYIEIREPWLAEFQKPAPQTPAPPPIPPLIPDTPLPPPHPSLARRSQSGKLRCYAQEIWQLWNTGWRQKEIISHLLAKYGVTASTGSISSICRRKIYGYLKPCQTDPDPGSIPIVELPEYHHQRDDQQIIAPSVAPVAIPPVATVILEGAGEDLGSPQLPRLQQFYLDIKDWLHDQIRANDRLMRRVELRYQVRADCCVLKFDIPIRGSPRESVRFNLYLWDDLIISFGVNKAVDPNGDITDPSWDEVAWFKQCVTDRIARVLSRVPVNGGPLAS